MIELFVAKNGDMRKRTENGAFSTIAKDVPNLVVPLPQVFVNGKGYRMLKRMMKIALGSEVDKSYVVEEKPVATGGPHYCWRVR